MSAALKTPEAQSGLFFVAVGVATTIGASQYPIGTLSRMGPGYFPLCLGILLTFMGTVVACQAFWTKSVQLQPVDWRSATIITASILLSAVLLALAGLAASLIALVVVSSLAAHKPKAFAIAVLTACLVLAAWLIFIRGLDMPVPWIR